MSEVKQTFTGDISQLERELKRLQAEYARLERENQKLASGSRRAADDERRSSQERIKALDAEIRKTQDLKRARGELIVSTNFVRSSRDGGGLAPTTNFTRLPIQGGLGELMIPQGYGGRGGRGGGMIPWAGEGAAEPMRRAVSLQESLNGLWTMAVPKLAAMYSAYQLVQSALAAFNRDMQQQQQLQRESLTAHKGLASAQAELWLNTIGQDPATTAKYEAAAARISRDTGINEKIVGQTLYRQAGRGVALNPEQIIASSGLAAELTRHNQEQFQPLASLFQQTMRVSGKSPEWSAAIAQSGAAAAYPGNPTLQARFLGQSFTSALPHFPNANDKTVEQLFELSSFVSQAAGEERGEAARTTITALGAQLAEFREGRGAWEVTGSFGRKSSRPVKGMPENPLDAIRWMQANPGQMKRFLDKVSFERQFEGIWRQAIMEPDSVMGKLLAATETAVKPDLEGFAQQRERMRAGTPQVRITNADEEAASIINQFKSRATRPAVTDSIRGMRDEAAKIAAPYLPGTSAVDRQLDQWLNDTAGYWTGRQAESYLGHMRGMRRTMLGGGRGVLLPDRSPESMPAEQRAVLELLNKLIEKAEQQIAELKKQNQSAPSASPAAQNDIGRQRER